MANKLDDGFTKADSRNLPKVDIYMIYEFLITDDRFNDPEVRGAKTAVSSRESYGDSAIGYVSVKRQGNLCVINGKICPEHKVKQKNYSVTMSINEEEHVILDVKCLDCAASHGGCKHAFGFLMWIHRRSEEPSCTDTICYWKKSKLSGVGTVKKFLLASEIIPEQNENQKILPNSVNFLKDVVSNLKEKQIDVQLSRYLVNFVNRKVYCVSMHQLFLSYCVKDNLSADNFLEYAKGELTTDICEEAEKETKLQRKSLLWYELRYGRITASKIYEAARCKTKDGSLVKQIVGVSKVFDTYSMQRGRDLEDKVFEELNSKGFKIEKCGFMLIPSHPFFGASPDAVGEDFIVEIKCPSKKETMKNYIENGKITDKCNAQMHLQMLAARKNRGLFCVADYQFEKNKTLNLLWVTNDESYAKKLIEESSLFWKENVYGILIESVNK